jgi:hypothetical protein
MTMFRPSTEMTSSDDDLDGDSGDDSDDDVDMSEGAKDQAL